MNLTRKIFFMFVLICFLLLNSTVSLAADSSSIDDFLSRKNQVVQQWIEELKVNTVQLLANLKNRAGSIFNEFLKKDEYLEKGKKSLDQAINSLKREIEDLKREYGQMLRIREM